MRKRALLYDLQAAGGAAMGEYHGWETAMSYGPVQEEIDAAVSGTAFVDASMFGRITVKGTDRLDLIHRLSTNDVVRCNPGTVTGTVFLTDKGRIIDRVVLFIGEDSLLLITSPGMESNLIQWIDRFTITEDIHFRSITQSSIMFYLFGHDIASSVRQLLNGDIGPDRWTQVTVRGAEGIMGVRHTSSGEAGYILFENPDVISLYSAVTEFARESGARLIGSTAYEAFRICQGIPLRGSELNDRYTPLEVGLREEISFTKGCYIGQEVIARLETYQKTRRGLAGVLFTGSTRAESGDVIRKGGMEVGVLTSVLPVPVRGLFAGLCVVSNAEAPAGTTVQVGADGANGVISAIPIRIGGAV